MMNEKTLLCTGRTYRGVVIHKLPTGEIFILGKDQKRYDFISVDEARAFVDAEYAQMKAVLNSIPQGVR